MIRKFLYAISLIIAALLILALFTIIPIDRTPYKETAFYQQMDQKLDSITAALSFPKIDDSLQIGWSSTSITPKDKVPLAGYGARRPKIMTGIEDSVYAKAIVFKKGNHKAALVTADLLIIHPVISRRVWKLLHEQGWSPDEIYFTATHTHSGMGGWAPGPVGELFAGDYEEKNATWLANQIARAVVKAEQSTSAGSISYLEFSIDHLVKNRLAGSKGTIDPWLKVIQLTNRSGRGYLANYSAHPTCYGPDFRKLSGDYPAALTRILESDASVDFSAFSAGAMGSMGRGITLEKDADEVLKMASELSDQISYFDMIGGSLIETHPFYSFQVQVPLRDPYFKFTEHLALRPYLFDLIVDTYPAYIRVLRIGQVLFVGLPCDFSGELSTALYERAKEKGLSLVITSFNGEYIGYVIKDEWYDLPAYESRTMSWYGPDTGAYFQEILTRIIDAS